MDRAFRVVALSLGRGAIRTLLIEQQIERLAQLGYMVRYFVGEDMLAPPDPAVDWFQLPIVEVCEQAIGLVGGIAVIEHLHVFGPGQNVAERANMLPVSQAKVFTDLARNQIAF